MQYVIMPIETEPDFSARTDPAAAEAYWAPWVAYSAALEEAGVMVTGAALQEPWTATTLRLREGERLIQDGPFADTKEQLGGFFVIDVADLDEALTWAARCPSAGYGAVEVRPALNGPPSGQGPATS